MLLCRRVILLHRGMGDGQSPMSCLIICLDAVIIPRFPLVDKSFPKVSFTDAPLKIFSLPVKQTNPLRHASRASSRFQGSLFF